MLRSSYPPPPPIVTYPLSQIGRGRRSFPATITFFYCSCLSGFFRNLVLEQCNFVAAILEHFPVLPLAHLAAQCIHIQPHTHPSKHLIDLVETVICIPGSESSDHPRRYPVTLKTIPLFTTCARLSNIPYRYQPSRSHQDLKSYPTVST
jgi:hypothetical protein